MLSKMLSRLSVILFFNLLTAQNSDYLVTLQNDTISANIIEIKKSKIIFQKSGENKKTKRGLFEFSDLHISDPSILDNPTNLIIREPDESYADIYLYFPASVRNQRQESARIFCNGEKVVHLKENRYYRHTVKAGKTYEYTKKTLLNLGKTNPVEINPESKQVYFIRAASGRDENDAFGYSVDSNCSLCGLYIFRDNPKVAKYLITTVKKEVTK